MDLILASSGPLSAGELTNALRLSPAATTTVIDRLERAGLVSRIRDSHNRRRVLVTPTDAARVIEQEIYLPVGAAGAQVQQRSTRDGPRLPADRPSGAAGPDGTHQCDPDAA